MIWRLIFLLAIDTIALSLYIRWHFSPWVVGFACLATGYHGGWSLRKFFSLPSTRSDGSERN